MISHISNGFQWYPHFIPKWGIPLISPWIHGIPLWNFPSRWSPIGSGDVVPRASNGCCGWRLGRGKNPELSGRSRKTPRKWWFSWENHGKNMGKSAINGRFIDGKSIERLLIFHGSTEGETEDFLMSMIPLKWWFGGYAPLSDTYLISFLDD